MESVLNVGSIYRLEYRSTGAIVVRVNDVGLKRGAILYNLEVILKPGPRERYGECWHFWSLHKANTTIGLIEDHLVGNATVTFELIQ